MFETANVEELNELFAELGRMSAKSWDEAQEYACGPWDELSRLNAPELDDPFAHIERMASGVTGYQGVLHREHGDLVSPIFPFRWEANRWLAAHRSGEDVWEELEHITD